MGLPEDDLLARCRAGDVDAFGTLYQEHHPAVFRHAYRLLGSREDALDACQDTFVRAFPAIRSFRGECRLVLWLLRICSNQCHNLIRTRQRRREVSIDAGSENLEAREPSADPAAIVEERQLAGMLFVALERLSPVNREILVLREIEGLSTAEVAAVLGCSAASVSVKLCRARIRLKEQIRRLTREKG